MRSQRAIRIGNRPVAIDQPGAAAFRTTVRLRRLDRRGVRGRPGRSRVGDQQQSPAHRQPLFTLWRAGRSAES